MTFLYPSLHNLMNNNNEPLMLVGLLMCVNLYNISLGLSPSQTLSEPSASCIVQKFNKEKKSHDQMFNFQLHSSLAVFHLLGNTPFGVLL